jgi:hypothetical protein
MRAALPVLLTLVTTAACVAVEPARSVAPVTATATPAPVLAASAAVEHTVAPVVAVPRSPFAYANIDPTDDDIVGPPDVRESCGTDLAAGKVVFQAATLPIYVQKKSKITCGAPQVVTYRGSPAKITWSPSVLVTCTMALALARFETIVQEEAERTFGKRVVRIHHLGTFVCREMAAYPGWVSEHSYANAIDIAELVLENGATVSVLDHFGPKQAAAKSKEGTLLRALARRAYDEEVFSSVLTPFFDKLHANHFHVDLARYRSDGTTFGAP